MTRNAIVLGLGFGDEGKGNVTDALVTTLAKPLVVRFSGGHQAGHTVILHNANGQVIQRHVFSNFGAGTLRGAPTYWSKYCTVEPIGLLREMNALLSYEIPHPTLLIDGDCPVCTPFDIFENVNDTVNRQHGTCGLGFGKTIQRHESGLKLFFRDLYYPLVLQAKLEQMQALYAMQGNLIPFLTAVKEIVDSPIISCTRLEDIRLNRYDVVFEGSQGILLDQDHGFFPNVTRSSTTPKNALSIIKDAGLAPAELIMVTRSYLTRHGNGFFPETDPKVFDACFNTNPDETNVFNAYQLSFRRTFLRTELLKYAMETVNPKAFHKRHLVITCIDHLNPSRVWVMQHKTDLIDANIILNKVTHTYGLDTVNSFGTSEIASTGFRF